MKTKHLIITVTVIVIILFVAEITKALKSKTSTGTIQTELRK